MNARELIAWRAAQELKSGEVVNLGIGIPTLVANYIPKGVNVIFHTENGALGFGATPDAEKTDPNLANAGSEPITLLPGASTFDVVTSLMMMRGGHLDITILGALEVDQEGNIANWAINRGGKWWPGIGGAMDLAYGAKKIIATLMHTDKKGNQKILKKCNLPLTGKGVVKVIITEKAVFDVTENGLVLREVAPGVTVEEIKAITDADFTVADTLSEFKICQ